jgi:catalase
MSEARRLTTASVIPVADNRNSSSAGSRGPLLLQDFHLIEKLQNFDRERRRPGGTVQAAGLAIVATQGWHVA